MENIVNFLMDPRLGALCIHSGVPQTPEWEDVSFMRFTPFSGSSLNVTVCSTTCDGNFSVRILKEREELTAFLLVFCGEVTEEAGEDEIFLVSARKF